MSDFFSRVPLDLKENLAYRKRVWERAHTDEEFRSVMIDACKKDILFFLSTFCWIYEPRPREFKGVLLPTKVPFIPWVHQVPVIRKIEEFLGKEDIAAEKSRGEGMSWIGILFAVHYFLFKPMSAIGLVSKDEASVDTPDNPDSLMWKIEWEIAKCLPYWMIPDYKRSGTMHTMRNIDNGATIAGFACTGNVASGGRKTFFLVDELSKHPRGPDADAMASTQHVTESRLIVATPFGTSGEYYRIMHEPSSMVKLVLDWKDNPTRNRGLYELVRGKPVAIDPVGNPLPPEYDPPSPKVVDLLSRLRRKGFKLEGRPRSPWYDHECDRPSATPQSIAQELDRDYGGSMYKFFGNEFFENANDSKVKPKNFSLDYKAEDITSYSLNSVDGGPVWVYCSLDTRNRPPERQYVVGVDIAAGLGGSHSSNSVCQIIDVVTGEQVLEYATNTVEPKDFADDCIALCKIFHDAYLIWEINGPGSAFTMQVMERGYNNFYMRKVQWKKGKSKKTKEPGWHTRERTKEMMFADLNQAVKSGELKLKSEPLVTECAEYVRENGKIVHIGSKNTDDGSSKGEAHGDRVMAMCIALQGVKDKPSGVFSTKQDKQEIENAPSWTFAGRNRLYEEGKTADEWDARTNWELSRFTKGTGFGGNLSDLE